MSRPNRDGARAMREAQDLAATARRATLLAQMEADDERRRRIVARVEHESGIYEAIVGDGELLVRLDGHSIPAVAWKAWSDRPEHGGEHFGTVMDPDFPVAVGNLLREALLEARLWANAEAALRAKVRAGAAHQKAADATAAQRDKLVDAYARAGEALARAEEYILQYLATGISPAALDDGKAKRAARQIELDRAAARRRAR